MPPKYTQAGRQLSLTTPLGADVLLLETLEGVEAVSELFRYELSVLTAAPASWTFDQLLGKNVTVNLLLPDKSPRYFNGIVSRVAQGDLVVQPAGAGQVRPLLAGGRAAVLAADARRTRAASSSR